MVLLGLQAPLLGEQPGNGEGRESGREGGGGQMEERCAQHPQLPKLSLGLMLSTSTATVDGITNELK